MAVRRLVTVVGATGAQGGAVVRSLIATDKYRIRALTRDPTSEKAQAVKKLSDHIELVKCDMNKKEDIQNAFKDSWAVFALTDFWAQPDKPEMEFQQGTTMADVAAELQIPYFIISILEDATKLSGGKCDVPHFSHKARVRDYIKKNHPTLKAIYVEPGFYMQNWLSFFKTKKSADGPVTFAAPVNENTKLYMVDIEDTGPIVSNVLNNPDKYVNQDICICGDALRLDEIAKVFSKVTGVPAVAKTLSEEEYRSGIQFMPKSIQDDLFAMFQWFQEYGYYGKDKDWTTGKQVTELNTFEQWLKKTGWKGE